MKIISAQQAKVYNNFKNTKMKLLKTNAIIWYNSTCKTGRLKPNKFNLQTNGKPQYIARQYIKQ